MFRYVMRPCPTGNAAQAAKHGPKATGSPFAGFGGNQPIEIKFITPSGSVKDLLAAAGKGGGKSGKGGKVRALLRLRTTNPPRE